MKLILGDCIEKMKELPENSVDAIITDPPYGLEFMGKEWDKPSNLMATRDARTDSSIGRDNDPYIGARVNRYFAGKSFQDWCKLWAIEALRVLKPGGFMFAMGGTRTHHRLTCGIEDAGFLIRDELCWVYMAGFPKAQDLAMMIEKKLGGKGKYIGKRTDGRYVYGFSDNATMSSFAKKVGGSAGFNPDKVGNIIEPTLPLAKEWQGWKTPALKPAFEPIIVAQKPCEGSITENVMKSGLGGFNIDECRIPYENKDDKESARVGFNEGEIQIGSTGYNLRDGSPLKTNDGLSITGEKGRFPSNLMMIEPCFGKYSKFFLIPKANKSEKEENLEELEIKHIDGTDENGKYLGLNSAGNRTTTNPHPTVKPVRLMEHLIKLTTKAGYTVLDPFMGSGTTGIASINLNRNFIGIELDEGYFKIAEKRIGKLKKQENLMGDWK